MNRHLHNIKIKIETELLYNNDLKPILNHVAFSVGMDGNEGMSVDEILNSIKPEFEVEFIQYFWTRYGRLLVTKLIP